MKFVKRSHSLLLVCFMEFLSLLCVDRSGDDWASGGNRSHFVCLQCAVVFDGPRRGCPPFFSCCSLLHKLLAPRLLTSWPSEKGKGKKRTHRKTKMSLFGVWLTPLSCSVWNSVLFRHTSGLLGWSGGDGQANILWRKRRAFSIAWWIGSKSVVICFMVHFGFMFRRWYLK